MPKELTQGIVEQWVALTTGGQFTLRDIHYELGVESSAGKKHLRMIMYRLVEKGIVATIGRDGTYKKVDSEAEIMAWEKADPGKVVPLKFPFGLEEFVRIYPKSIIMVAGSKNVGKSAWLYNFIILNMNKFDIDLYNSETGLEQMKERFDSFKEITYPVPFMTYMRYDNFADVIDPDRISVIDYLDFNSEVYLIGDEIDRMFRKLNTGIVVAGVQKPPPVVTFVKGVRKVIDRDLGYGGAFSAKRAVLYITMSNERLKLVYVKVPRKGTVNPNNATWSFQVADDGAHFLNIKRFYGEQEGE